MGKNPEARCTERKCEALCRLAGHSRRRRDGGHCVFAFIPDLAQRSARVPSPALASSSHGGTSSGSLGRRFDRVTVPRNATPKSNQDRSGIGAGSGSISVPTRGGCMAPRRAPSLASEGVRAVGPKEATTTGSSLDWERRPTPERLKSLRRRLIEKHACGRAQF